MGSKVFTLCGLMISHCAMRELFAAHVHVVRNPFVSLTMAPMGVCNVMAPVRLHLLPMASHQPSGQKVHGEQKGKLPSKQHLAKAVLNVVVPRVRLLSRKTVEQPRQQQEITRMPIEDHRSRHCFCITPRCGCFTLRAWGRHTESHWSTHVLGHLTHDAWPFHYCSTECASCHLGLCYCST